MRELDEMSVMIVGWRKRSPGERGEGGCGNGCTLVYGRDWVSLSSGIGGS